MIVVDASVAGKWLFPHEVRARQALALLTQSTRQGDPIVAPHLLPFEVANIVRQRMIRERLALVDADQLMVRFAALPVTLQTPTGLSQQALAIADAHGLPAAYDAHYVALAQQLGCDLWTDDQRLIRQIASSLPFVRPLAHYPLPSP
jgi:predicted nucleic acid-binding protein